jgi:hypothetical protein
VNTRREISAFKRSLCLQAALSLLLFLVISAPHRVHHFFDEFRSPQADHGESTETHNHATNNNHENRHKSPPASKPADCFVLSVAQNVHGLSASPLDLPVIEQTFARKDDGSPRITSSFDPSPCSQRAPPLI